MKRARTATDYLHRPLPIFFILLLTIFGIESLIMLALPRIVPVASRYAWDFTDAILLALLSAPFVWLLVASPLRNAAISEYNRTTALLENMLEAVINFDAAGNIESMNAKALEMFEFKSADIVGQPISRLFPELALSKLLETMEPDQGENGLFRGRRFKTMICNRESSCFAAEVSFSPLQIQGRPTFLAIVYDLTERKRLEASLTEQKEFAENLVRNNAIPTFVMGRDRRIITWNRACEELTGITAEAVLSASEPWQVLFPYRRPLLAEMVLDGLSEPPAHYCAFGKSELVTGGMVAEEWYRDMNGTDRYLYINASPIHSRGELIAVIETLQDITERKQYEEQLEFQTNHDLLTGLPNRILLEDRIRQALLLSTRSGNEVAVIFIDLDHFKFINDNLGHTQGDEVVKTVARRIKSRMKPGDTLARQGGDEFVVVISDPDAAESASQIADRIQKSVSKPLSIGNNELNISCSMGISVYPKDANDVLTLMKNADIAMYRAKEMGRNNFQFYAEDMNAKSLAYMTTEKYLRKALDKNEFFIHYQPKASLSTGRISGTEALLRWKNPDLGMVSPASFIPLAEETGLIVPIGEWVLQTACTRNRSWQEAGLPPTTVAVNLSSRQFRQENIHGLIERVLRDSGLEPGYLELEITESMVMENTDRVMAMLKELKELGIQLTMDDFGTGYSSLAYLNRFPFDNLKIDLSFVRDITNNPSSAALARTVIAMAHSLHMKVIAEGVETEGQLRYLRDQGCDEIQGYYFSRPVPGDEFGELLRSGHRLDSSCLYPAQSNNSVLVVDDEEQVNSAIKRVLELHGHTVHTARSALEGFEVLACHGIAVVISDYQMPGMKGVEFLSRVKELYPNTVRILITGHADLKSVTDGINKGAVYKFINKPWRHDELLKEIGESLTHHDWLVRNNNSSPYTGLNQSDIPLDSRAGVFR